VTMTDQPTEIHVSSVRATADPGPLGLAGFALTTFVLSTFNAGIVAGSLVGVVLPLALFYGGLAQFLAGMWEFKRANGFGAVAFTTYGAFWMSFAAYAYYILPKLPAATAYEATGLYLLAWTIITVILFVASLGLSGFLKVLFALLALTFLALTVGALGQSSSLTKIGGYLGIVTAVVAWYGVLANLTNQSFQRKVLPL
jgi:succinate-acetate transporter protein